MIDHYTILVPVEQGLQVRVNVVVDDSQGEKALNQLQAVFVDVLH